MRLAGLVGMFWRRRGFPAVILLTWTIVFIVSQPVIVEAQQRGAQSLDSQLAGRVNRLYPGFEEILTSDDPRTLARFARFLSDRPSPDTLSVLVWMLRYCPAWDEHPVLQISATARAIKTLPLSELSQTLVQGNADQREKAVSILSYSDLIAPAERPRLVEVLLEARKDPHIRVRESAISTLHFMGYRDTKTNYARVSKPSDPNVTYLITGDERIRQREQLAASSFPPATVALMKKIFPLFPSPLVSQEHTYMRQMLDAIERAGDPNATPVLLWQLRHGDRQFDNVLITRLTQAQRLARLPFENLGAWLETDEPGVRKTIAELFDRLLRSSSLLLPRDRQLIITALISALDDRHVDVIRYAHQALGYVKVDRAVQPLIASAEAPDLPFYVRMGAIEALVAIESPTALRALERWARSSPTLEIRERAAQAYIAVAKPANLSSEARRLFWEQPDTQLERQVLAQGVAGLPLAWKALNSGSTSERRAAAALLGWFPNTGSIKPILNALSQSPGALTRQQLLFDLNMILLAAGTPADGATSDLLAGQHLRWLYDQLPDVPFHAPTRSLLMAQKTIVVFPHRVTRAFSSNLAASNGQAAAVAVVSESPQAFLDRIAAKGCGVAFHAITVADGVARVATTLYLPGGGIGKWISLYRYEGGKWVALALPPHPVLQDLLNEPNLLPAFQRNYGAGDPLKILRLDLTMERIRVDLNARDLFRNENRPTRHISGELDASYVPLLEKYRRSDAPSVRFTAELTVGELTGQPNIELWINALAEQSGTPYQAMAQQVIARHTVAGFKSNGVEATGAERDALTNAALKPDPVDPRLVPKNLPQLENIYRARRWDRFGLVDVRYGSAPLGMSGYSLLFERRGDRWVFLCVVLSWIS